MIYLLGGAPRVGKSILGQRVATLAESPYEAGEHWAVWHGLDSYGRPVSSGIYFYRIVANGMSDVKKMILIR